MLKFKLLIIDSEPRWINFAKDNLVDFEIVVVSNTDEAVEVFKKDQFDLVIASSLQLKALEEIKQNYNYIGQPLYIATTEPNRKEEREAYLLGARRYFPKRFDPVRFRNEIESSVPCIN